VHYLISRSLIFDADTVNPATHNRWNLFDGSPRSAMASWIAGTLVPQK